MKIISSLCFFLFILLSAGAQSTAGITGIADTSYNINNEYRKLQKNYPHLQMTTGRPGNVSEKKDIVYAEQGSRKLLLDVFSPAKKNKEAHTAIIIVHGGGWRSGHRSLHYALAQRLAAAGYICFTPEYRLSTEALYPAAIQDVKAAIQWVRKNAKTFHINTEKIVVAGHSAGGQLAALAGTTNGISAFDGPNADKNYSSRVNAVIDIDGTLSFVHPESSETKEPQKQGASALWLGYTAAENPGVFRRASPLTYVGPHTPPILFLNSAVERMHAGREDFTKVLNQFSIYNEVKTFEGAPHSFILFDPWLDSSVRYIDRSLQNIFAARQWKTAEDKLMKRQAIVVAQDGTGDFTKVQDAFNAIPYNNKNYIVIRVKPGVYTEKLFLDSTKDHVSLMGDDKFSTILTYNDHTGKLSPKGDTIGTRTSWSCKILADNFLASNITFQNDAGFTAGQAVALESDGDKATFTDCRFIGNQDVLFLNNEKSRQFFQLCYIEGTTDFIFGSAAAWFSKSEIYSKKNSHITAAATPASNEWGFVFDSCKITGDAGLNNVSLGRPWRPYAAVVYLNCYIGQHIKPEGWSNWNNTDNYKTTRYAEYNSYGPSADPATRVRWSKQLTEEEARKYDLKKFMSTWYPPKPGVKTK